MKKNKKKIILIIVSAFIVIGGIIYLELFRATSIYAYTTLIEENDNEIIFKVDGSTGYGYRGYEFKETREPGVYEFYLYGSVFNFDPYPEEIKIIKEGVGVKKIIQKSILEPGTYEVIYPIEDD